MKNCAYRLILLAVLLPTSLFAQTDTVVVQGFFETNGVEGTLNAAIAAVDSAQLSNKVFKLKPYEWYVLTGTIRVPAGQRLTIVAPDPGATQETAPPQIRWTASGNPSTTYNFECYGDIYMKNVWMLYANTVTDSSGVQVASELSISEDPTDHINRGVFENVIFDYVNIGSGGGAVTVAATHARLHFKNCYFRNCTDTHFRYYGRAVSYRFATTGYHVDSLTFENTTFANMGYVLMQEGGEYADYVKFNHCTFLNTVMFTLESGWWNWLSVTNSVFVNAYMFGHLGDSASIPAGGALNIDSVSNFGFTPPFNDADRHIVFANNSYYIEKWLRDYMAPYNAVTNPTGGNAYSDTASYFNIPRPQPYMSEKTKAFFNNKTAWPYIWMKSVYDSTDPGFLIPPTNQNRIKTFLFYKWTNNLDINWAFDPNSDVNQKWPMNEQLRYTNSTLKTAGMGGFPLGDLYRWWNNLPTQYQNWKAQAAAENDTITKWLTNGIVVGVDELPVLPSTYELQQNYPNPFNPTTQIDYSIPQRSDVTLKVYNVLGVEIATLFSGVQEAGKHIATFDATKLSTGVYFYRLQAGDLTLTKKMLLMK